MKKSWKRWTAALLSLPLCLGLAVPSAAAGQAFSDVPQDHWACSFLEKAAGEGWVAGVGDGLFGVDNQVTYAEFSTMLVRAYYEDDLNAYTGPTDPWYTSFCNVANDHNLYWNSSAYRDDYLTYMNNALNRYEMAQILYNLLEGHGLLGSFDLSLQSGIGDWDSIPTNYRTAVIGVVSAGLISGVDENGAFGGDGYMTRGQAAVVMCRLDEGVNGGEVTQPEEPEPTPDPEPADGMLKNEKPATTENVIAMLKEIEEEYPTGAPWSDSDDPDTLYNPNPVSTTMTNLMIGEYRVSTKYGCSGFAAMVSDLIFPDDMPLREVTDFSKVRPGDIVFNVGRDGTVSHVWVAISESELGKSGYWGVKRAEGNSADQVIWNWDTGYSAIWGQDEVPGRGYHVVYTRYPD